MTIIQSILSRLTEAVNGTDKELYTEDELNKFATFYLDKWDENTSEDVIAESFTDFWWDTDRTCRRCSICGKLMREGYCVDMGAVYYLLRCSCSVPPRTILMKVSQNRQKSRSRKINDKHIMANILIMVNYICLL